MLSKSLLKGPEKDTHEGFTKMSQKFSLGVYGWENHLAISRTLNKGKETNLDGANAGKLKSEFGANHGSSQCRPHMRATSYGSHLNHKNKIIVTIIFKNHFLNILATKTNITGRNDRKKYTHCNLRSID